MKPRTLTSAYLLKTDHILEELKDNLTKSYENLGNVDICRPLKTSEQVFQILQDCAIENKMFPRLLAGQLGAYNMADFLVTSGSIATHVDVKLGTVLTWLISSHQNPFAPCGDEGGPIELITDFGTLPIKVGDLFVFNASKRHALLSNQVCVFAQTQVGLKRKSI